MAKYFGMMEALGHTDGETMRVNGQVAIDSIGPADAAVLIRTTRVTEVLRAITELPSVPLDEEYQFRKRSTDLLQKWNEVISPSDKNQAPTSAPPAIKKEGGIQNRPVSAQVPPASPAVTRGKKGQNGFVSAYTNVKDAVENVMAIISRRQTKSLTVNGPSTHPGIPMDRHTQGSVSRYPDAFRNPKPHRHRCRRKASAQISAQEDPETHR